MNKKEIEAILAKSDGTNLLEHIDSTLKICNELKEALPKVVEISKLSDFWDLLFCAVYFHDFGKIHTEFQKKLKGVKNHWEKQRHEVYSIPFIYKLNLEQEKINLIARAVLGHHKSFDELKKTIIDEKDLNFEYRVNWKNILPYHPKDFYQNLRKNFPKSLIDGFYKLFHEFSIQHEIKIKLKKDTIKIKDLKNPIKLYCDFKCEFLSDEYFQNLMLWAGLKVSDHLASAGIKEIVKLNEKKFHFINKIERKFSLYEHQKRSFSTHTSSILIAPTGTGKTESALGWLKNTIAKSQGRVFYILPFTASINAMHRRLIKYVDNNKENSLSNTVGILHGNISHYLSEYFPTTSSKEENKQRNTNIKKLVEQYKSLLSPISIATPFQLLKYFFGIKGFEKGLFFLSGAKLIFDEIHAYDIQTFAQIVVILKFLKIHLLNDVFIMTATLPTFMINILKNYLKIDNLIYAEKKLLANLKRHKIILIDDNIFSFLEKKFRKILNPIKRYIFVCNTVHRAQKLYKQILKMNVFNESEVILLHGRFNQRDRNKKEIELSKDSTKILIGTQTIEVSLDIDYDVMITEPAPLDALIQRFGRVNRNANKKTAPIYICKKGGNYDKFIYPLDKIDTTLSILKNVKEISENDVQSLLDKVYPSWNNNEQKFFKDSVSLFEESLKSLMPYSFSQKGEEEFYSKFTDIKVLPIVFYEKYRELLKQYDFIEAEKLLVSINRNFFFKYFKEGIIERQIVSVESNDKTIEHTLNIIKLKYSENYGLINEIEEGVDTQFNFW